ncbi:MAG TPA: transglutaminase, partial [Syntrophomonas sp.]|nr:transglutaminase [Syntrophomonas sp.]
GLFLSIYVTRKVFFEHPDGFFKQIYDLIPLNLQTMLYGQDVLIYMVFVPILLLVFSALIRLFH